MAPVITPLPNTTFGCTITGVSLANLSDAEFSAIHQAFLDHGLLVFPSQNVTPEQQAAFGKRFGKIEVLVQGMDAVPISNKKPDGTLLDEGEHARKTLEGNEGWHSDSTYMATSAKASCLCAHVVPAEGGETEFADMRGEQVAGDGLRFRSNRKVSRSMCSAIRQPPTTSSPNP